MKKSLLAFSILTFLFASSVSYAASPFRLGLRTGLNIANASFDPDLPSGYSKSARTGFAVGGVAEVGASDMIFIAAEPMYIQKGVKVDGSINYFGQVYSFKSTSKASFLEIPVLIKAKFGTSNVKPYVFAGPSLGITLTSKAETEAGGQTSESDIKDSTSSTDFSIAFGGGAEFSLNNNVAIGMDARYALGLSDLNKESGTPHQKIKTNGIQILVCVLFKIGS